MWFAASLLYQSVHNDTPTPDDLWEDRIVLVEADSEQEAQKKAEFLGKQEDCGYVSATGDDVRWTFRQVERVCRIEVVEHGAELFSRFLKGSEVASMLALFKEHVPHATALKNGPA